MEVGHHHRSSYQNRQNPYSVDTVWGKFDHYLLDRLLNVASKQDSTFFITAFTTTNHDPFVIPEDYKDKIPKFEEGKAKYLRAKKTMAYNDLIIKEFYRIKVGE